MPPRFQQCTGQDRKRVFQRYLLFRLILQAMPPRLRKNSAIFVWPFCENSGMKRICVMTTYPLSLEKFNLDIFHMLRREGYEPIGLSGTQPQASIEAIQNAGFTVRTNAWLVRQPHPLKDLVCLCLLWWFFIRNRFDIVHCSTPKAMLLGTLAGFLSGHRRRVITVRGRAYENTSGLKRRAFVWLDRLTCALASRVICVSPSLRQAMLNDRIGSSGRLVVFGQGGSKGVNPEQFDPVQIDSEAVTRFRGSLGLGEAEKIVLFVGRVRQDKGINELVRAFTPLADRHPGWRLLVLGMRETVGALEEEVTRALQTHPQILTMDYLADPRVVYAASELVVLPTWREGFPNVPLEAAAMERPVITTDAVGAIDSVENERTGRIVPWGRHEPLRQAMADLMGDEALRRRMGRAGRERVLRRFHPDSIHRALLDLYKDMLGQ